MGNKCGYCGKPFTRYPIKRQPEKTLKENCEEGTIIWKNLFKMDFMSIIFFIMTLILVFSYSHDIAEYEQVGKDPCGFCQGFESVCEAQSIMIENWETKNEDYFDEARGLETHDSFGR